MLDLHELVDRIHYDNRREYTRRKGNVDYLDSTPLARPISMPRSQRIIALIIVVIGIVIGAMIINNLVVQRWEDAATSEQKLADNLAREASIETIPNMADIIGLDNETIVSSLSSSGNTLYDATSMDDSLDLLLYRVPADMTLEEAEGKLARGIGSLDVIDGTFLLNGSWQLAVDRVNGTSMVVRYADFSTGDLNVAIQSAIYNQGFDPASVTASGVDESGNSYTQGTLDANGKACTWRVSALPLDDIYSIPGLPENACYVGIRVTVA